MKRFIWISSALLFFAGCGSRNVRTDKTLVRSKEETKEIENFEKHSQTTTDTKLLTEVNKTDISQEKQSTNVSNVQSSESYSKKNESVNNSKSFKKTEYYPNGQKKSETESSEQYSRISSERDFYKNQVKNLENKLNISIRTQDSIYKQNLDFAEKNGELIKINKQSLSVADKIYSQYKKSLERKGISFGSIVWIILLSLFLGAILWEAFKKYLPTKVLSIIKIKK